MSLYYCGNVEDDMKKLYKGCDPVIIETLDQLGMSIGYGRCQQILQILWAKQLQDRGLPTNGALFR